MLPLFARKKKKKQHWGFSRLSHQNHYVFLGYYLWIDITVLGRCLT